MVRINLLPHREARRKERKAAFVAMLIAAVFVGGLMVLALGWYFYWEIGRASCRERV